MFVRSSCSVAGFLFCVVASAGCGGPATTDDGGVPGDAPAIDGAPSVCTGMPDGSACGSDLICVDGTCGASECGDGYVDVDGGEICDDGNAVAFDGCEPSTCVFTCDDATDCDDGASCNGVETCSAAHVCAFGTAEDDGTSCTRPAGAAGVCRSGDCVPMGCGNGITDAGEDCDDMNDVEGDGCDGDCTFSCVEDVNCADGDVCNGEETCDAVEHTCSTGTALDCDDGSACTADECDALVGCSRPLIDGDGDGHAPMRLGACGDDCDDARADVFTGAEELCDGVDNDCDGDEDEVAPTWYIDCDDDGFAASTDGSRMGCAEPDPSTTGCGGGWTNVRPIAASSTDCNDTNEDVFPGQTAYFTRPITGTSSYDYDCSGSTRAQYGCLPEGGCEGLTRCSGGGYLPVSPTNPNGCCVGRGCVPTVSSAPACGESALYSVCTDRLGMCETPRGRDTAQGCR